MRLRLVLGTFCLVLATGCTPSATNAAAKPQPVPRAVTLVQAGAMPMPRVLDVTGVLAAQEELVLGFQVAGRLRVMNVDAGDRIQGGQMLAELDQADFELARARSRAMRTASRVKLGLPADGEETVVDVESAALVREALAVLAEARLARDRTSELVRGNLRSQAELEVVEAANLVAESKVQAAREQVRTWIAECQQRDVELQQSLKNLQDSKLLAPWAGRVADRRAVAGQFVQAGSAVLVLLRTDPMRLRLQVSERQAQDVRVGMTVRFTVDGGGAAVRSGVVRRIGASIERVNRTLLVEAEVANGDDALRPGSFCRASIVLQEDQSVVAVPKTAVVTFAGIDRVYEVEGNVAKERVVVLGRRQGDMVEIQRGVETGLKIVEDARGLLPNAPVTVKG